MEYAKVEINTDSGITDCEQFKLVPILPTKSQLSNAAFNLCSEFGHDFVKQNEEFALAVYRELLASSPTYFDTSAIDEVMDYK
jgi:hypothetical protein